ncbi:MAG: hypothetical protein U0264_02555 [Candidatus Kapaibacterium sp.]
MLEDNQTPISTYHEYILEAISALRFGLSYYKQALQVPADVGSDPSMHHAELFCRYSFLMISNSLEAAANTLLLSLKFEKVSYDELEKLGTIAKFQLYCELTKKKLNRSDVRLSRVKDIITCRNEFVHPKPKVVNFRIDKDSSEIVFDIKRTNTRNYPKYFIELKPLQVLTALDDTLNFISWVCFDICQFDIVDGSFLLGLGTNTQNADLDIIGYEHKIKFDQRTFGQR